MGSADRDYMREKQLPSGWTAWGWASRIAVFAVVAFIAWHLAADHHPDDLPRWTLLTADAFRAGRGWTILTTSFAPSQGGDAAFTLFAFWFFGRAVEREVGSSRFLAFTAVATIVPHLVFAAVGIATGEAGAARGFGGAAAAAAAFTAVREPSGGYSLLGFTFRPRWVAVGYLVLAAAAWAGWLDRPDARLPVEASAMALGVLTARFALLPDPGTLGSFFRSRVPPPPRTLTDAEIRTRIDALLDRISQGGMESLTQAERDFLKDASKRYR